MRAGREREFGEDYIRCFDELKRTIQQLGGQVDPAQISLTAELIIQTMSGPWRYFHTSEHIFEVGESGDEIEILSALFHDLVYVQVDQGVSVNISRFIAPFVKEIDGQLVILEQWQLPDDPMFNLILMIFGFHPGQTLLPMAGQNEFLSAVIAAKCLEHALVPGIIAEIAACIEATIPFRPPMGNAGDPCTQLFERLNGVNAAFQLGWDEEKLHAVVRRAVRLANRDVENFAYESSAEFLDNTWNLMPETNHDLTSANAYTVTGYRVSLQKMEGFMNFLKPEVVFHRYQDEPDQQTYELLVSRTQKNLEVARLYLGTKLLSISLIEALSQRIGQDIPLATMMGELPGRGLSVAQLENFLPAIANVVLPTTILEQEVLDLIEKGRTKSSTYDVKNSPVATFIVKSVGFAETRRVIIEAKEFFKKSLTADEFLARFDPTVVDAVVQAVLQVFEHRQIAMSGARAGVNV